MMYTQCSHNIKIIFISFGKIGEINKKIIGYREKIPMIVVCQDCGYKFETELEVDGYGTN